MLIDFPVARIEIINKLTSMLFSLLSGKYVNFDRMKVEEKFKDKAERI